jgi:hypothetical protein
VLSSFASYALLAVGIVVLWYAIRPQERKGRAWGLAKVVPVALAVALLWFMSFRIGFGEGAGDGDSRGGGSGSGGGGGAAAATDARSVYRIAASRLRDGALVFDVTGPGMKESVSHVTGSVRAWESLGLATALARAGVNIGDGAVAEVTPSPAFSATGRDALREALEREGFTVRFTTNAE